MSSGALPGVHRREVMLAALIFVALVLAAFLSATAPLRRALAEKAEVRDRLTQHETALAEANTQIETFDPALVAAIHSDESEAQLVLQSLVDGAARAAGFSINSVAPAGTETIAGLGHIAWMEMMLTGDFGALIDFLTTLDEISPLLIIGEMSVTAVGGASAGATLGVRIRIGRIWRTGATAP